MADKNRSNREKIIARSITVGDNCVFNRLHGENRRMISRPVRLSDWFYWDIKINSNIFFLFLIEIQLIENYIYKQFESWFIIIQEWNEEYWRVAKT